MPGQPPLDMATLRHVAKLLEDRLQALVTYGAGGCPACHDAELRGAIASIKRLAEPMAAEGPGRAPEVDHGKQGRT